MRPSLKGSTEYSQCDLKVVDSSFRVVRIEMETDGELWVWLPWSLDYPSTGGRIHALTLASFGHTAAGLN